MHIGLAIVVALQLTVATGGACPGIGLPVEGPIIQTFAPVGRYGGHWGIDIATPLGTAVAAVDGGIVSFAGVVVSNRTVTVDHGGGLKSSYSFVESLAVGEGDWIRKGDVLARSGVAHGSADVHFTIRIDGTYVDPQRLASCRLLDPGSALRVVPTSRGRRSRAYPGGREKGHSRRNFRSATYSALDRRRDRLPATGPR